MFRADDLLCFLGVAPVVERSGTQCWTHWRFKCNKPLRQALIDWTFLSLRESFWAEQLYKKLRAKGKTDSVAIRAVAFKWGRIIFRMWKDKTPYSEARYLRALQTMRAFIPAASSAIPLSENSSSLQQL